MRLKPIPGPSIDLLLLPESDTEYVHFEDAQNHPFDHGAQGFSPVNAWWLADAALLAYWDERPARPIWTRAGLQLEFFSEHGVQCHVASHAAFVIVAFRGTQPNDWHDLFDIARIGQDPWEFGGAVHRGILSAHNRIWPTLEKKLKEFDPTRRPIWFTGHSLGGALATLSMDRLATARGVYTIGAPPLGNRRFVKQFDRRHAGRCFRYVNHRDIVVHLPRLLPILRGRYRHVKLQKYIDAQGRIGVSSPSIVDWFSILIAPRVAPQMIGGGAAGGLLSLPGYLVDHTPRRYAVYIWNDFAQSPSG